MKKISITTSLLFFGAFSFGQVGVNNQNPQATMDITAKTIDGSKPEGLIAPRLTGDQIKSADAQYNVVQRGTLIYATSAVSVASVKTVNITAEGYYYFDGNIWQKVGNGSDTDNWKRSGNAGTVIDFIGTTNAQDFVTKTNDTEAMRVTAGQQVLIGTSTVPIGGTTTKVIINNGTTSGAIQIKDGTEGLTKVLTSDSNGVGAWKLPTLNIVSSATVFGGVNVPSTSNGNIYTNSYIDIPPGKYLVTMNILLTENNYGAGGLHTDANESWTIQLTFSDSPTSLAISPDVASPNNNILGLLPPSSLYSILIGNLIINNTLNIVKRYYLYIISADGVNRTGILKDVADPRWGNNRITYQAIY